MITKHTITTRIQDSLEKYRTKCEQRDTLIEKQKEEEKQAKETYRKAKKEFQALFEETTLIDIKKFTRDMAPVFKEYNLLLKCESHLAHKYFSSNNYPPTPFAIIAVEDTKTRLMDRWQECNYIAFESDIAAKSVKLYLRNNSIVYMETSAEEAEQPIFEFKLEEYNFEEVLSHIEAYLNKELDRLSS